MVTVGTDDRDGGSLAHYDVVIVGAGHGGAQAAIALRQQKFAGSMGIFGDEPDLPYERPPLSKDYLSGEKTDERLLIRPASFWADRDITIHTNHRVTAIDPVVRVVTCADGTSCQYGHLIWAAGGAARRLSCEGHDLTGVHTIRTRADVDRLRAELPQAARVVVVGGGYIGLEAAAVMAKAGKHIVVLEALDRVLARVAGAPLSRFYEAEHRAHGVEIRLGAKVEGIEGVAGKVSGVRLATGEVLPCDMVVVGIGIVPSVEPLVTAGAQGANGVKVDGQCRTTLPQVYAIGDCALHANRYAGDASIRLESVQNANDQAMVVAKTIVGEAAHYDAVPWFWSNQYDLKLQTVGLSIGHDDIVVRGDPARRSFSVIYKKAGGVIALDCVNAVKDYVQGRRLVVAGSQASNQQLADTSVQLKDVE